MINRPILSVKSLSKQIKTQTFFSKKATPILHNISFELQQGQALGVVGESGAGKSTLARLLCGLEQANEGEIWLAGKPIQDKAHRKQHLSVVFQDYTTAINPTMNVLQAISEPLIEQGLPKKVLETKVVTLLEKVGLSANVLPKLVHQLSGGQAQRVNLCRALITRPSLIIFDEALSALDLVSQVQILDLLIELKQQFNLSYLLITHNIQVLCYLCDSVLFLSQGKLVEQCKIEELAAVQSDYAKRLLRSVI